MQQSTVAEKVAGQWQRRLGTTATVICLVALPVLAIAFLGMGFSPTMVAHAGDAAAVDFVQANEPAPAATTLADNSADQDEVVLANWQYTYTNLSIKRHR